MILSLLIGLVSVLVSVLGLKCTRLGRTSEQVKGQLVLSGGVLFLLSGMRFRTRVAVSLVFALLPLQHLCLSGDEAPACGDFAG